MRTRRRTGQGDGPDEGAPRAHPQIGFEQQPALRGAVVVRRALCIVRCALSVACFVSREQFEAALMVPGLCARAVAPIDPLRLRSIINTNQRQATKTHLIDSLSIPTVTKNQNICL